MWSQGVASIRAGKPRLGSPQLRVCTTAFLSASEAESPGQGSAPGTGTALLPGVCFWGGASNHPTLPVCRVSPWASVRCPAPAQGLVVQEDGSALLAFPELGLLLWWQSTELLLHTWVLLAGCGWSSLRVLCRAPTGGLPEPPCLTLLRNPKGGMHPPVGNSFTPHLPSDAPLSRGFSSRQAGQRGWAGQGGGTQVLGRDARPGTHSQCVYLFQGRRMSDSCLQSLTPGCSRAEID